MGIDQEKQYMQDIIDSFCVVLDKTLNSGMINVVEYKQKLSAISSFLEFLRAGADVSVETLENDLLAFIIKMK